MKVALGGGKSTANVIGNPVDDKSEGVIMFFGGGVLVPGMVFVVEIITVAVG